MIHDNVERVRKAKGITKTFIATQLGLSLQGYRHITSGEVRLDVERLSIIANILGVNPGIFFDEKLTESVIKVIEQHKQINCSLTINNSSLPLDFLPQNR
ncbi:helix-turn-helix transcriptional regulator [Evansella sp. AB-P1]|uniref:helix-turn-helix domain-containing protein n=1 Tax=Evansella sp. AB-P1 TaxID=3037653 RepID=UPI00241D0BB8|nr:helix-turn-helix transcriptional regulator [Evansella sp. AB-P1]MDG5787805.1 helix-turn-helix transcriptional regulator [Evansella sp. AB-P1]